MSTNTKQVLDAAWPFVATNEVVAYLFNMVQFYESDLRTKITFMRARMDTLENVVEGCDGYSYQLRSDIGGKLGTDMDILQAQIFEMTSALVIVLNSQCGLALEW